MSANALQFPDFLHLFSPLMMFDCGKSAPSKPSADVDRTGRAGGTDPPRAFAEAVGTEDADAARGRHQIWKLMDEIGELMGARS